MAWIQKVTRKDGTSTFWVRDVRRGRQVVIFAGLSFREAEMKKEQYEIRRDLEKEGYDDVYDTDWVKNRIKKTGGGEG